VINVRNRIYVRDVTNIRNANNVRNATNIRNASNFSNVTSARHVINEHAIGVTPTLFSATTVRVTDTFVLNVSGLAKDPKHRTSNVSFVRNGDTVQNTVVHYKNRRLHLSRVVSCATALVMMP
jgi:hypothetical protein